MTFHHLDGEVLHSVGFGSGPATLVTIPGVFVGWQIWQQPLEILSERWRVVGIDHAGVGLSRCSPEQLGFERQVETVMAVLDQREIESCVLAGDSFNVALAVEVALRHPSRVDGLVLMAGTAGGFDTPTTRQFIAALRSDFSRTLRSFARASLPEDESGHLQKWLIDMVGHTGPEMASALVESYLKVDVRDRLGEVAVPTLVLVGSQDEVSSEGAKGADKLASAIPGARLEVMQGIGHVPTLSRPEAVAELIDRFMTSLSGGRGS